VIHFRACNLCEAICGLAIEHDGERVLSIKGDPLDPLSRGHICPKAVALKDIHEDPDRLRRPVKRTARDWEEISWQAAFDEIAARTRAIRDEFGSRSLAVYLGNPTVHNYGAILFQRPFVQALGRPQVFSATSVDQLPHHYAASFMLGHSMLIPIPDVDRTNFVLMLGANPLASNGSIMTAPGIRQRLKAIKKRGGRVIVIDPRRTETAGIAEEHYFIRPGTDVWLLSALVNVVFEENLGDTGRLAGLSINRDALEQLVVTVTPELAAAHTGIGAETIRGLARDFAASDTAVCYGRIGVSTQRHGGLCQWLINALNVVTGNFDRPGGAMLTHPAVGVVGRKSTLGHRGRWKSRVRQLPEFDGQLPVATMGEEILAPGEGRIRALFTNAGNPVLSTPNGRRLEVALQRLDLMVSIDIYINETTRHADFILPPACGLEVDHYDLVFHALAVRNTTKFSPALFAPAPDALYDWQVLDELTRRVRRKKRGLAEIRARTAAALFRWLTPSGILDLGLKIGPYGAWGSPARWFKGLTLARLKRCPHGEDLGPLEPKLPGSLRTPDKKIDVAPEIFRTRFKEVLTEGADGDRGPDDRSFELIGRRQLRSNNSWMHNSLRLIKGRNRCTILMHPNDADRLHLADAQPVRVTSGVGEVELPLERSEDVMPGVVSMPHGFGHNRPGTRMTIAEKHAGVSINDLTDDQAIDPLTGNAAFSGQRVTVASAGIA